MKFKVGDKVLVGKPVSDKESDGEYLAESGAVGRVIAEVAESRINIQFQYGDPLVCPCPDWQWVVDEDRLTLIEENHSPDAGNMVRPSPAEDGSTTERLVDQIRERHQAGLKKYGVTVDRNDLEPMQWVQHFREELLDALAYLQRIEDKLNTKCKPTPSNE